MSQFTSYLAALHTKIIQDNGTEVPRRKTMNFIGVTITDHPDTGILDVTFTGGSGEVNTASNVGSATGEFFKQKTGVDLEFKTLAKAANDLINIANGTSVVTLSIPNIVRSTGDPNGVTAGSIGDLWMRTDSNALYQNSDGGTTWATIGGSGDVVGPASATDNAIVRFDGTTGKLIQNSGLVIDDSDVLQMGGNPIREISYTEVSPTALSAQADNYDPASFGTADLLRVNLSGSQTITGFAAPGAGDNQRFTIRNIDAASDVLTLANESASSTAANRITCPNGIDLVLNPGEAALITYEAATTRWVVLGISRDVVTDHGGLTGLTDDDHTIYALLAGRSGGQTLKGGTGASENLVLQSTASASRGNVSILDNVLLNAKNIIEQAYTHLSPTALSAQADDYDPSSFGTAAVVRQDLTGSQTITGFSAPGTGDNHRFTIVNIDGSTDALTLSDQDASSTAANRIICPNGNDIVLRPGESATLGYDSTSSRWRIISVAKTANDFGYFPETSTVPSTITGYTIMWAASSGQMFYRRDDGEIIGF